MREQTLFYTLAIGSIPRLRVSTWILKNVAEIYAGNTRVEDRNTKREIKRTGRVKSSRKRLKHFYYVEFVANARHAGQARSDYSSFLKSTNLRGFCQTWRKNDRSNNCLIKHWIMKLPSYETVTYREFSLWFPIARYKNLPFVIPLSKILHFPRQLLNFVQSSTNV